MADDDQLQWAWENSPKTKQDPARFKDFYRQLEAANPRLCPLTKACVCHEIAPYGLTSREEDLAVYAIMFENYLSLTIWKLIDWFPSSPDDGRLAHVMMLLSGVNEPYLRKKGELYEQCRATKERIVAAGGRPSIRPLTGYHSCSENNPEGDLEHLRDALARLRADELAASQPQASCVLL